MKKIQRNVATTMNRGKKVMNKKFIKQVKEAKSSGGFVELFRQAHISLDNLHYCKECFCCACITYLNELETDFFDMADVIEKNKKIDNHWFDEDTMNFFKTKFAGNLINGRFFITSEKQPHGKRAFTIRMALPTGRVQTLGEVCQYPTKKAAREVVDTYYNK